VRCINHLLTRIPSPLRALAIREASGVGPNFLGETRMALARALWVAGTARARALSLAEAARENFASIDGMHEELAQVEGWLASR
jgi:hypothetical protein